MHMEQEQHFQVLLQTQQEDHRMLQGLIESVGTPAAALAVNVGSQHITLIKMGL